MPNAAVASASIPGIFPPYVWEGKGIFMDGGTVYNINVEGAINRCMDGIVDDESKIIVDVLICGESEMKEKEKTGKSWESYLRARKISKYYGNTNSLVYTMKAHPTVNFRHVVNMSKDLGFTGLEELNFNGDFTWKGQEQGRTDAQSSLNNTN